MLGPQDRRRRNGVTCAEPTQQTKAAYLSQGGGLPPAHLEGGAHRREVIAGRALPFPRGKGTLPDISLLETSFLCLLSAFYHLPLPRLLKVPFCLLDGMSPSSCICNESQLGLPVSGGGGRGEGVGEGEGEGEWEGERRRKSYLHGSLASGQVAREPVRTPRKLGTELPAHFAGRTALSLACADASSPG